MRRALALAAVVVSARQDHSCAEDVCFYHIPKTGGDSRLPAHGQYPLHVGHPRVPRDAALGGYYREA